MSPAAIGVLGVAFPRVVGLGVAAAWFRPARRRVADLPDDADRFSFDVARRVVTGWTLGTGDPVLLVHGWGGASTDMAPIAESVAASGRMAVVPDLPGHGHDRRRRTDLFLMRAAIDGAVASFGMPDVVVAHSFGAAAVLHAFAHGGPSRVVLIAPAVRMDRTIEGTARMLGLRSRATDDFARRVRRFAGPAVERLMRGEGDVPGATITLFHDPADAMTSADDSRRFAGERPDRALIEVTGVGHRRILSDPSVIDQVVAAFPSGAPTG